MPPNRSHPNNTDTDTSDDPMPPSPRFIVVGAGPAGCALAAALAEEQEGSVVLLEMGADLVGLRDGWMHRLADHQTK